MDRVIPAPQHVTAEEDRVDLTQKVAYSAGSLVNNLQAAVIPEMAVILNLALGVSPLLLGLVGFIPRLFDSLTDPIVGYISDNTRTKWGRRRPFIIIGAPLAGIVFAAMWQLPSGYSQYFYFGVFLLASIIYFLSYSLFATPFIALGYEMTPDYHERTRLHAFANTVGQLPWLFVPWFYFLMSSKELFTDRVQGARVLAICVGIAICLLGILPAIFCRERTLPSKGKEKTPTLPVGKRLKAHVASFFSDFVTALHCRPFAKLCGATFLVFNAYQVGISFTLYVLIYYVFSGNDHLAGDLKGRFGTLTAASSLLVIPLTGWVATKIGKRETFLITMSLSLMGYLLKWFGYNQENPSLLLLSCPFIACGIGSLFTLMSSMVADVCDYDELESGRRREGLFGAIFWWVVKIGMALAQLLFGVLLDASGFDEELASQSDRTLTLIRLFDVGIPIIATLLAIWIISEYKITEQQSHQIRKELEQRRGKLN